jgi:hypothetical protein
MKGSYQFTVDNRGKRLSFRYDVTFTASDTLPAGKKSMRYRLKADGAYVAGNKTTWCTPETLSRYNHCEKKPCQIHFGVVWPEGTRDNDFAAFATTQLFHTP